MPDAPVSRPAVLPPTVDPEAWEEFPAFRETFLPHYTAPEFNAALRAMGAMLLDIALDADYGPLFPEPPDPIARHELAAAAADLRHMQGFLRMVSAPRDKPGEPRLCALAGRQARNVAKIAAAIEAALAGA